MAYLRQRGRAGIWFFTFTDEDGRPREIKGTTDRAETERMARDAESLVGLIERGVTDRREIERTRQDERPISQHATDFKAYLLAKGSSEKHAEMARVRVLKLSKAAKAKRLSGLTVPGVQGGLRVLRVEGLSLATVNHYRTAIKTFIRWARLDGRTTIELDGVTGFNAKTDRRHDRRALTIEELKRLITLTETAPAWRKMSGPARALCYRMAMATGLRYSGIRSVTPECFDWKAQPPVVTVAAAYTKNGDDASLHLPSDLVGPLKAFVKTIGKGKPIFELSPDVGAKMIRPDLERAGIDYRDADGRVFDFHALRCQLATNADAAGISPRVVQAMMRHSTLELTGRYTKPRKHDLTQATEALPGFAEKPSRQESARVGC